MQGTHLRSWQAAQMLTEAVHDAVDRLIGHRFVLVATSAKHDDVVALQHAIEEASDESALANAGRAMHIDGRRRALLRFRQGRLERVQVLLATDERWFRVCL